jgi:hypothetical protein
MYGILSVTVGFGHVNNDSLHIVVLIGFTLDRRESAEEEAAGKGHDGGAARGDLVAGLELIEFAEGVVDVGGGTELFDVADEGGGNVGLVEVPLEFGGVLEAEARVRIRDGHTATTTAGGALLTMRKNGIECSCRAGDFRIHESSSFEVRWTFHSDGSRNVPFWEFRAPTPAVFVRVANKGVAGYGTWKKIRKMGDGFRASTPRRVGTSKRLRREGREKRKTLVARDLRGWRRWNFRLT